MIDNPLSEIVKKKSLAICALTGLLVYMAGYFALRFSHILVHSVSYATDSHGVDYFHSVKNGDLGPGLAITPEYVFIQSASPIVFRPMILAETIFWQEAPRTYNL